MMEPGLSSSNSALYGAGNKAGAFPSPASRAGLLARGFKGGASIGRALAEQRAVRPCDES